MAKYFSHIIRTAVAASVLAGGLAVAADAAELRNNPAKHTTVDKQRDLVAQKKRVRNKGMVLQQQQSNSKDSSDCIVHDDGSVTCLREDAWICWCDAPGTPGGECGCESL